MNAINIIDLAEVESAGAFYVYVYRDVMPGREGLPIYVGKGTENEKYGKCARAAYHWNKRRAKRGSRGSRILQELLRKIDGAGLIPLIEIAGRFSDESSAFDFESVLIAKYGRRDLGNGSLCNLSDGGEGPVGSKHSEDAKRKIGEAAKKMHSDADFSARRALAISQALSTPESRLRRSKFMKEVHSRDGQKAKRIASQKAAFSTPEHKLRRSAAMLKAYADPEVKKNHSAGLRARHAKTGARETVAAKSRATHANPETKEKHRASMRLAMKAIWANPDYRAKKLQQLEEARKLRHL